LRLGVYNGDYFDLQDEVYSFVCESASFSPLD
jgi:hypothetical protein